METVEGVTCDSACMRKNLSCMNWCDDNPDGNVECAFGHLPNVCEQECCTSLEPTDPTDPEIVIPGVTCNPACMEKYLTCREKCSVNSDGSVVRCDGGHLPLICKNKCCEDGVCPEEITCTSECTLSNWGTFFQECLQDYKEEITKNCVTTCKAKVDNASSPSDCPELSNCQALCCTETSEEYFHKCKEQYDEGQSHKCVEDCTET